MGSVTAKVVPCDSTCVGGNPVTSPVLMGCSKDLPPAATVMGDQGHDRDKIHQMLAQQGITPSILPRRCRKKPVHYSKRLYRKGHKSRLSFPDKGTGGPLQPATTLRPRLPFCHPLGRHCPLLVTSPDPSAATHLEAIHGQCPGRWACRAS